MAIDERSRHALYTRLEDVLGEEHATVLMEHMPPVGWADVATKRDLDHLSAATKHDLDQLEARMDLRFDAMEERVDARFEAMEQRFDARMEATEQRILATVYAAIDRQTRVMIFGMASVLAALAGVAFGAGIL